MSTANAPIRFAVMRICNMGNIESVDGQQYNATIEMLAMMLYLDDQQGRPNSPKWAKLQHYERQHFRLIATGFKPLDSTNI